MPARGVAWQDAQQQIDALPALIAAQPAEVPGARDTNTQQAQQVRALLAEVADLAARYTEENPILQAKQQPWRPYKTMPLT